MDKKNLKFDPMALVWSEKYKNNIDVIWSKFPHQIRQALATIAIFLLGLSVSGDWINIFLHAGKQFGFIDRNNCTNQKLKEMWDKSLNFESFSYFCTSSLIVSYGMYFGIGGFLHWYFYVHQRDRAEEWKCQPKKWQTPELERHEILLGSFTLFVNAIFSATICCHVYNGGLCTIYYDWNEYGWTWFVLQWPVTFIYQDYTTYWAHRIYHTPFLYKNFHKLHHKYKQPTAFSVTAIHPVESLSIQMLYVLPIFVYPVHWFSFYAIVLYTYYHGIIDHSGINFKAYWWQPWQPDAIFHDNHHQYFHVNFAFNISYWDKLHGTNRKKDRVYTENIFFGKGKSIDEVSPEELKADLKERESENPLAYRGNKMEFLLTEKELNGVRKSNTKIETN